MNELSLFTGAGGGLLGTHLLGWRPVGYVEWDDYCQRVLAARIRDGILPAAPIFSDVRAFLREGYADAYQGMVDVVTAGFPCQPFSVAGKQRGADDERNMWPATIGVIRAVRPRFCLLENVPGLVQPYLHRVLGDLAESGYDARWRLLSVAETGGAHLRDRLWIVANDRGQRIQRCREEAISRKSRVSWGQDVRGLADGRNGPDIPGSGLCRSQNDVACYVDRLRAIGNGQVPRVVATAWQLLTGGDNE